MKHEQRWKNYDEFLKSPEWLHLRDMILKRAAHKCQLCDSSGKIQVHHRNYSAKWGEESTDDLIALCGSCHRWFHKLESKRAKSKKRERSMGEPKSKVTTVAPPVVELRQPLFVSFQINEIMAAPDWSALMPDERRIALDLMMMMWSELDGMVADDDWMIARRLGLPEKEWLSYRETLTRTGWLIECDGRLANGITKREFDNAQAAYMRSIISGAMGGRKAAENRKRNHRPTDGNRNRV